MKKITLLFIVFCFFCSSLYSATPEILVGSFIVVPENASQGQCNGSLSIQATGTSGPFTLEVLYPDGTMVPFNENTEWTIDALCAGEYTITFYNQFGCNFVEREEILDCLLMFDDEIRAQNTTQPSNCNTSDGSIRFFPYHPASGGSTPYTYTLYDEEDNEVPGGGNFSVWDNLSTGSYYYIVVDAQGCEVKSDFQLGADFEVEISTIVKPVCPGDSDGHIYTFITAPGEFDVEWSNGSTSSAGIDNLSAGEYCITVTLRGGDNCEEVECFEIEVIEDNYTIDATVENACPTRGGNIYVDLVGGVDGSNAITSVSWNDGATNRARTNLDPGTYCVTATQSCGYSASECFVIGYDDVNPNSFTLNAEVNSFCDAIIPTQSSKGSIQLSISGGNGNQVSYEWDDGQLGPNRLNLAPGMYCVTAIQGPDECQTVATQSRCYSIDVLDVDIDVTNITHCNNGDCSGASIEVTASSNEDDDFTFIWFAYLDDGTNFQQNGGNSISDLPGPGEYTVQARLIGRPACTTNRTFIIEDDCADVSPLPDINSLDIFTWPTSDFLPFGGIDFPPLENSENLTFSWTGPNGFASAQGPNQLIIANGPGTYTLVISNGCDDISASFIVEECTSNFNLSVTGIDERCADDGYAFATITINNVEPNNQYYIIRGGELQDLLSTGPNPNNEFSFEVRLISGEGAYSFFILDSRLCASEVVVNIGPGNLDITEQPFFALTSIGNNRWIAARCDMALFCGNRRVGVMTGDPVQPVAVQNPNGGCQIRYECGEDDSKLELELNGILQQGTTPDITNRTCVKGEFCEAQDIILNPIFASLIGLAEDHAFVINATGATATTGVTPMESEMDYSSGFCRETLSCDGVEFVTLNHGAVQIFNRCNRLHQNGVVCEQVTQCPGFFEPQEIVIVPEPIGGTCCGASPSPITDPGNTSYLSRLSTITSQSFELITDDKERAHLKALRSVAFNDEIQGNGSQSLQSALTARGTKTKLSPNPAMDMITLYNSSFSVQENARVTIVDINGKSVIDVSIHSKSTDIQLTAIPKGIYFAQVILGKSVEVIKFIKQ